MTMTKKEREELESLRRQLLVAKAFRFTERVLPDVLIPTGFGVLSKGFLYSAHLMALRFVPACSSSVGHNFGSSDETNSRNGRALYSTELLALRALRNDAEQQCANWLADIDKAIERTT
jgi:hypothetical protein